MPGAGLSYPAGAGSAYHGPWDDIRATLEDPARVNYTWFETHVLDAPWNRGPNAVPYTLCPDRSAGLLDSNLEPLRPKGGHMRYATQQNDRMLRLLRRDEPTAAHRGAPLHPLSTSSGQQLSAE